MEASRGEGGGGVHHDIVEFGTLQFSFPNNQIPLIVKFSQLALLIEIK